MTSGTPEPAAAGQSHSTVAAEIATSASEYATLKSQATNTLRAMM
jgi:hypothetical protein